MRVERHTERNSRQKQERGGKDSEAEVQTCEKGGGGDSQRY